ncbi:MAG: SusC/RagA family TonB-linked outer membrane protein [Candidatus Pseudobacter hemicellulosilyticus]|uniref:SusC/RagA family TonB-linked outer membrane protein n=1 Tax=Candidatus Pseudobacter hemicellulosilyticus TaxID=3121375 RepID=A0AAJ6BEZ8_9BACT|nr:MAG: SusC/RagA family TonB-linked outer membrane protein [Pseudobacter sp.]
MQKTAICGLLDHAMPSPFQVVSADQPTEADLPANTARSASSGHCPSVGSFRLPAQMLKIMRLTFFFLFAASLAVSAHAASQTVSLSGKNLRLEKVFAAIEKQTGFLVFASENLLNAAKPVSLSAEDMPLLDFLALVFREQPLSFRVEGKTVFLSEKRSSLFPVVASERPAETLEQPPAKIRVADPDGQPLAGATVTNRNTKKTGETNAEGLYSLDVSIGDVLEITFIGFEKQSIIIKDLSSTVHVSLSKAVSDLREVVINKGYYTTTQRLNTGSVSRVTSEQIKRQPISNPMTALQGMAPGVLVTQSNGLSGSAVNIMIRGQNSLRQGSSPLYIVDGVAFGNENSGSTATIGSPTAQNAFNLINPADIESIEVLKDADATAIYGSRGANGVILITTKHAAASDRGRFSFTADRGFSELPRKMDLLSTKEYLRMRREAFENAQLAPTKTNAPDLMFWDTTRYTDWQRELLGNPAQYTDLQAQYSGGNARTQFLLSTGYHHDESTIPLPDDGNKRLSALLNVTHKFNRNKGNINAGVNYVISRNQSPSNAGTFSSMLLPPDAPPLYNEDGSLNWADATWFNPLAGAYQLYSYKKENFNGHINVMYYLFDRLYVKVNVGLSKVYSDDTYAYPRAARNPISTNTSSAIFGNSTNQNWIAEPQIGYDKRFGSSKIEVLLGASWQGNAYKQMTVSAFDYTSDELLGDVGSAGRIYASHNQYEYAYSAAFGRFNYNWQDKHILNATVRRDVSSRFSAGSRGATFGSVGYAWIFSEESWLKDNAVLSFGKLKMSYGTSGNDQIGNYQYLDTYGAGTLAGYEGIPPLVPTALFNPSYHWELTRKLDVSIDLGLLKDRLSFSVNYFRNRSSNQLLSERLPSQTGFTSITNNQQAKLQNSGWEFQLNSTNIRTKDLRWSTSLNLTLPRNKLIAYPGLQKSSFSRTYIEGESYTQPWFGYHFLGVNPNTGLYDFLDVNGDGLLSSTYDYVQYKRQAQPFYGGLNNRIEYKGISLDFLWYYNRQTINRSMLTYVPGSMYNQLRTVYENAWRKPGDVTNIPRLTAASSGDAITRFYMMSSSDGATMDGSYLRLRNASLAYNVRKEWLRFIGAESCRIYCNAQNLLTISKFKTGDPETQSVDIAPPLRTYVVGISLSL